MATGTRLGHRGRLGRLGQRRSTGETACGLSRSADPTFLSGKSASPKSGGWGRAPCARAPVPPDLGISADGSSPAPARDCGETRLASPRQDVSSQQVARGLQSSPSPSCQQLAWITVGSTCLVYTPYLGQWFPTDSDDVDCLTASRHLPRDRRAKHFCFRPFRIVRHSFSPGFCSHQRARRFRLLGIADAAPRRAHQHAAQQRALQGRGRSRVQSGTHW